MAAYRIKDWEHVFHFARAINAEQVTWCKLPVTRKGTAFMNLMATRDGRDAYCVFLALVRLVARGKTNGVVDFPMSIMASEACVPERIVKRSLEVLSERSVGWLESASEALSKRTESAAKGSLEQRTENLEQQQHLGSSRNVLAAAAEASPDEGERQRRRNLAAYIAKRPDWLPDGKPWITRAKAVAMAQWDGLTEDWWRGVVREARESRGTLDNPAGYVVAQFNAAKAGGAA